MKFLATFISVLGIVHAQARIGAPVMGYAYDPAIQNFRPLSGFPGAALIDSPADPSVAASQVAVAPQQDFIIYTAAADGSVQVETPAKLETRSLAGAQNNPARIVFSPAGTAVGLFQQDSPRIQIFTNMPQEPVLAREVSLAGVSGDVTAAAISDDGELALLLAGGMAWLSVGGSDPAPLGLPAGAAVVAFRAGSHEAAFVTGDGQVALAPDPAAGPDARTLGAADDATADPVAVRYSADGGTVYVVTRGGTVASFDGTGRTGTISCGCSPSGLFPLRTPTLFRLNEISDSPLMLIDTAGAQLRTWFVPALQRSAQ